MVWKDEEKWARWMRKGIKNEYRCESSDVEKFCQVKLVCAFLFIIIVKRKTFRYMKK